MENVETYISEINVAEIERTPNLELRNRMRGAMSPISLLSVTDEVEWLAEVMKK